MFNNYDIRIDMNARFNTSVTVSVGALSQEVAGETVILDIKSEQYFGLNEVGTRIWQLIQEYGDLQQVFDIMLEEYDIAPDQLETDMKDLLKELDKSGLVTYEDNQ